MGRIALICTFLISAAAASPPASHTIRSPCMADLERYCADAPFGNGRRIGCLARHKSKLAPACRERVKAMQAAFEEGRKQHTLTMKAIARNHAADDAKTRAQRPAHPADPN